MTSNASGLQGQVLAGRYRLVRRLGAGGMGTVWRADDLTLGSPVAIKLLDASYAQDESVRARFYQEARAAAALRSPNVVQMLDHGVDGGVPFIAMELLDGEDLARRIQRKGRLAPDETVRLFTDVARAVKKAHDAGIIHRDLKPDNIFIVRDDDHEVAKVLDFGVAKSQVTSGAQGMGTQAGALIGTLPYMSPEQARGAAIDPRTDLWALGVIAFECLCGRLPFTADAPGELVLQICSLPLPVPSRVAEVPPAFDDWFVLACNRDPNERFTSAKAMAEALRAALLGRRDDDATVRFSAPPASAPVSSGVAPTLMGGGPLLSVEPVSAPRPPTINGGSTVDFQPRPRPSASLVGAGLGLAALLLAGGLFVRWLVVRDSSPTPDLPFVAASSSTGEPAVTPTSQGPSEPTSPKDASSAAPEANTASAKDPSSSAPPSAGLAPSTSATASAAPSDKPSGRPASSSPAPSTGKPAPSSVPATTASTTKTDRMGI